MLIKWNNIAQMRNGPWWEFILCKHIFLPINAISFMLSKSNQVVKLPPTSSSAMQKKTIIINALTTYLSNNPMGWNPDLIAFIDWNLYHISVSHSLFIELIPILVFYSFYSNLVEIEDNLYSVSATIWNKHCFQTTSSGRESPLLEDGDCPSK